MATCGSYGPGGGYRCIRLHEQENHEAEGGVGEHRNDSGVRRCGGDWVSLYRPSCRSYSPVRETLAVMEVLISIVTGMLVGLLSARERRRLKRER